jgi:hypothetical protein
MTLAEEVGRQYSKRHTVQIFEKLFAANHPLNWHWYTLSVRNLLILPFFEFQTSERDM